MTTDIDDEVAMLEKQLHLLKRLQALKGKGTVRAAGADVESQAEYVATTPTFAKAHAPKHAPILPSAGGCVAISSSPSWDCPKCGNNNRPDRKECFRCRADKAAGQGDIGAASSHVQTHVTVRDASASASASASSRHVSSIRAMGSTSHVINRGVAVRARDWAPQADGDAITANNKLRDIANLENREFSAEWCSLTADEQQRAILLSERSRRNKIKKEVRLEQRSNATRRRKEAEMAGQGHGHGRGDRSWSTSGTGTRGGKGGGKPGK